MKVIDKISPIVKVVESNRQNKNTIGFIPTMGALHKGHLSLIQKARKENDIVLVSIFVNPKQFTNTQDLKAYTQDIKKDKALIQNYVDYLFTPTEQEIYPEDFHTLISVGDHAHDLEGQCRPGHFEGMVTIVCKLVNICQPTRAYFGLKDYQQFIVISQMIKDLNMNTKIISAPTTREPSGLAMSSRNARLSIEDKNIATQIYRVLLDAKKIIKKGMRNPQEVEKNIFNKLKKFPKSKVEYVAVRSLEFKKVEKINTDIVLLVAIYIGSVRLIDNIIVTLPKTKPTS